jgi:S-phase kinase-associated protein 1
MENIKGLDEDFEDVLTLISRDEHRFSIPFRLIVVSDYLKHVFDADSSVQEIHLTHIESSTLKKIIDWIRYHEHIPPKNIPKPLPGLELKRIVGNWDAEFMDCDVDSVYELLLASNFLGIIPLLELCCAKIASLIVGKTSDKIKEAFGLPEDFSYEDEAKIRKEFSNYL